MCCPVEEINLKVKTNTSGPIQIPPNPTSKICERVAHKDEVPTSLVDTTKDPTMLDWKWPPAVAAVDIG